MALSSGRVVIRPQDSRLPRAVPTAAGSAFHRDDGNPSNDGAECAV
jgi:hypothetical protein